jgi:predicted enzyme related to lactoylglutathione lyase
MPSPIVHWEIGGRNSAVLCEFYGKAFGWKITPAGPDYSLADPETGGLVGGIMQCREGGLPYVTVYVGVDDLDTKLRDVEVLGGKVVVPPTAISPMMSFAMFADPEGNVVGLLRQSDLEPEP